MAAHNELGKWGENIACEYLRSKGYVIIERDWRSGHRDLDIVALDGDVVVFVEVKTRRNRLFMEPEEAVDFRKRQSLALTINHYVKAKHIFQAIRVDIITVIGTVGTAPEVDHLEDITLM